MPYFVGKEAGPPYFLGKEVGPQSMRRSTKGDSLTVALFVKTKYER